MFDDAFGMKVLGSFAAPERFVSKEPEIRCLIFGLGVGKGTDGWRLMPPAMWFGWENDIDGCNWLEAGFSFARRKCFGVRDDLSGPGRMYRPHIVSRTGLIKRVSSPKETFWAVRAFDVLSASSKVTNA